MGKKNLLDYFTPQKGKKRKQSGKTKKRKATRSRSSNIETAKRKAVREASTVSSKRRRSATPTKSRKKPRLQITPTTATPKQKRIDFKVDHRANVLAAFEAEDIDVMDKAQNFKIDPIINVYFQSKYPEHCVFKDGIKTLNYTKMKHLRSMVRGWKRNEAAIKLNWMANARNKVIRLSGAGRKHDIHPDYLFMIYKEFNIKQTNADHDTTALLQCLDLLLSVFTFAMREGIKSSNTGDIWKCFIHCLTIYCKAYNLLGARGIRQDMAVLEKDLMDLDIFNVTRKAMQICANCATQSEQRVTRSCAYNVTYPLDSGTIQLIQKMDYFNDEECTSCGERSVLMATALDTQKWFQVYLDQHCYDSFDIKRLTTMDVMQSDGLCKTYKLKAVTVLDNGHYWMNSHDHSDGEFYEWESLSARIGPLTRIRTISGPTIAVLLFKEAPISLKNHRLIVVGFIRCESCNEIYPDVIDLVIKYSYEYPFKLRNGLELSSAMFGKAKADGSGLEHYLKKWKDTMHA
eukprot:894148_1